MGWRNDGMVEAAPRKEQPVCVCRLTTGQRKVCSPAGPINQNQTRIYDLTAGSGSRRVETHHGLNCSVNSSKFDPYHSPEGKPLQTYRG